MAQPTWPANTAALHRSASLDLAVQAVLAGRDHQTAESIASQLGVRTRAVLDELNALRRAGRAIRRVPSPMPGQPDGLARWSLA